MTMPKETFRSKPRQTAARKRELNHYTDHLVTCGKKRQLQTYPINSALILGLFYGN